MDNALELKSLVDKIVQENFADETEVYEEFADIYIEKLAADENPRELEISKAYSEFDPKLLETITHSLSTLAATVITILEFRKKNKTKNFDLLVEKWEAEMIANGIDQAKAKELSAKYGNDLKKYVA